MRAGVEVGGVGPSSLPIGSRSIPADGADLGDLRVGGRVPVGALRELEQVDHEHQRVGEALRDHPDELVVDG